MIRIIALDPGSYRLGVCYSEVSPYSFKPTVINTITIKVDALPVIWDDRYSTEDPIIRAHQLYRYLFELYSKYKPHQLVYEKPFFGKFRPNAFESLLRTLSVIINSYLEYNSYGLHFGYAPHAVKKNVKADVRGGKEAVKDAIINNTTLSPLLTKHHSEYSEHEYDAIAVLMTHCNKLKNDPTGSATWLRKQ